MQILSTSEQEAFDRPPIFDCRERKRSFEPPKSLIEIATELRIPASQLRFLVMCGYFKATKRFYSPQDFHVHDIEAAAKLMGLSGSDFSPEAYPKQTRARHRRLILDFYGFKPFDRKAKQAVAAEIATMVRTHLKPRLIFDRYVDCLVQRRIQVPRAGILLEFIRLGLQARKIELIALVDMRLTGRNHMLEKYSSPLSYVSGGATTAIGILTFEQGIGLIGIICTLNLNLCNNLFLSY